MIGGNTLRCRTPNEEPSAELDSHMHFDSITTPVAVKPTLNLYLLACALVAALGGLLFGFDTAVISGTTDALRAKFALNDNLLGFTVASALIGTIIGSIGRRGALALLGVIYFFSALGCAFAWDWWSFLLFRFMGGLAVGGASVVSPLYIAEISPACYRGRRPPLSAIRSPHMVSR
jgi:MFS transporter, SP family, xylose:H+ symportor